MPKALLLLSGGLDSTLAGKLLLELGIEVEAVNFTSPFCRCTPKSLGCSAARRAAGQLGIPVHVFGTGADYLEMVKRPRFRRGSGVNPCIDCRILIFTRSRNHMAETGADFIATGEVLGERPMSQKLDAMRLIERESGLAGKVLRPLSARLLEPSEPEKAGLVDRERLLAIQGRSRKPQMALARELGVTDYLCPAGGCLLTEREFAARFRDMMEHEPDFGLREARLLGLGRHFRIPEAGKAIVGRNSGENEALVAAQSSGELLLQPMGVPGPSALCRPAVAEAAASLVAAYTESGTVVDVVATAFGGGKAVPKRVLPGVQPVDRTIAAGWRVCAENDPKRRPR